MMPKAGSAVRQMAKREGESMKEEMREQKRKGGKK